MAEFAYNNTMHSSTQQSHVFANHGLYPKCRNPSLGLMTKARAYKVTGQERSPRVASHAPESSKECEGMNPHTPK